jgi:hypothetical protein
MKANLLIVTHMFFLVANYLLKADFSFNIGYVRNAPVVMLEMGLTLMNPY